MLPEMTVSSLYFSSKFSRLLSSFGYLSETRGLFLVTENLFSKRGLMFPI